MDITEILDKKIGLINQYSFKDYECYLGIFNYLEFIGNNEQISKLLLVNENDSQKELNIVGSIEVLEEFKKAMRFVDKEFHPKDFSEEDLIFIISELQLLKNCKLIKTKALEKRSYGYHINKLHNFILDKLSHANHLQVTYSFNKNNSSGILTVGDKKLNFKGLRSIIMNFLYEKANLDKVGYFSYENFNKYLLSGRYKESEINSRKYSDDILDINQRVNKETGSLLTQIIKLEEKGDKPTKLNKARWEIIV